MEALKTLCDFFAAIEKDPRIRMTHIAVYMALYHHWLKKGCCDPVLIISHELMLASKISSSVTYHRAIRGLDEYGYIRYRPSYNKMKGSSVFLIVIDLK